MHLRKMVVLRDVVKGKASSSGVPCSCPDRTAGTAFLAVPGRRLMKNVFCHGKQFDRIDDLVFIERKGGRGGQKTSEKERMSRKKN